MHKNVFHSHSCQPAKDIFITPIIGVSLRKIIAMQRRVILRHHWQQMVFFIVTGSLLQHILTKFNSLHQQNEQLI